MYWGATSRTTTDVNTQGSSSCYPLKSILKATTHVANTAAATCLIILLDRNTHKTLTQTCKLWQASAAQRLKRFAAATRSNFSHTCAAGDFRSAALACCQQTSFVFWTYRQSPAVCHLTQTHACTNRCSVRCKRADQPQKPLGDFGLSFIISHNLETSVYALSCCVHHHQSLIIAALHFLPLNSLTAASFRSVICVPKSIINPNIMCFTVGFPLASNPDRHVKKKEERTSSWIFFRKAISSCSVSMRLSRSRRASVAASTSCNSLVSHS